MTRARDVANLGLKGGVSVGTSAPGSTGGFLVGVGLSAGGSPSRQLDVASGDLVVGSAITLGGSSGIISATKFSGGWDGTLSIDDSTTSTSQTTGALVITGGVGIAKSLFVGEGISVGGTITYDDVTNIDSVGIVTAGGGIRIGTGGTVGPTAAGVVTYFGDGSNLTGIEGGIAGVNTTGFSTFKDVSVQGITTFSNLTDSSSTTTGALVISGGVGIAKSMYIGGNIAFADGQGIDFSATSDGTGTMSSEVLDDYEYGTWTPDMDNGTYTSSPSPLINATYVKIGHFVFVNAAYKNVSQFTSTANSTHFHDVPFNANDQAAGSACQANVGDLGSVLVNGSTWYLPTVDYDNNVNFTCVYNV